MNEMTSVSAWVRADFSRAELFEQLGIDFCCGGNRSLKEACQERQLSVTEVIKQLQSWIRATAETDCAQMNIKELCEHIVLVHHAYMKRMIPLITGHLNKIVGAHGEEFALLQQTFAVFVKEIEAHMKQEEEVAFPLFCQGTQIKETDICHALVHEHDEAGNLLATMRRLTHDYTPSSHACMTLNTCFAELQEMERDMHLHVFKENYILFPKITKDSS